MLITANEESCSIEKDGCEFVTRKECTRFDPTGPSVIIKDSNGRLGNHMFSVMTLVALKLRYGVVPYITKKTHDILGPVFQDLGMDVGEEVLCDFAEIYPKFT